MSRKFEGENSVNESYHNKALMVFVFLFLLGFNTPQLAAYNLNSKELCSFCGS